MRICFAVLCALWGCGLAGWVGVGLGVLFAVVLCFVSVYSLYVGFMLLVVRVWYYCWGLPILLILLVDWLNG